MHRLFLILILAFAQPVLADGEGAGIGPAIPEASGDPHPEGNAYMRRWHMDMMRHDRDETMYEGARDVNASIGECFECHAVKDDAGTPVTYADERHFCRTCHDFAAVQVDCFDCHRSTPEGFEEPAPHAALRGVVAPREKQEAGIARVQAYLDARPLRKAEVRP